MSEETSRPVEPNPPVIAAVDGSAVSYHAAAWAAAEAALHSCRLHLVTSVSVPYGYGPGPMFTDAGAGADADWLRVDGERILTEATRIARLAAPGHVPEITSEVSWSPIVADLIERSGHARMLVLGSRGAGALQRNLLGSVSTSVLRHVHCPVVVIHEHSAIDAVSVTQPVLVGIDGSSNSMAALALAFEEASLRKVGLKALHAWSDTSGREVPVPGWEDTLRGTEDALLAESLAGWSERYPDVEVHRILVRDRPVRALLDEAETAQLVVVGSHGRGGFAGMLLGATSNALVQSTECPTIVVREHADEQM
jgi:nucleotide-binding universal stress UspA family protein